MPLELIHKRPQEFVAALEFTSAETGFSAPLIEKDYWCSLVLDALFAAPSPLVFKGGTLLSKAYANFDRLSEDLDFTIPTPLDTHRTERSRRAHDVGALLENIRQQLGMAWAENWKGHNSSTQHTGKLTYPSVLGGTGTILVEAGQREVLERPAAAVELKTLLLNPLFSELFFPPIKVIGLSKVEAYAEKVRAALTRKEPAIRDIYDIWQAVEQKVISVNNHDWIALAKRKCSAYELDDSCSVERKAVFQSGIKTDLRPVLRSGLAESFDFDVAWNILLAIHGRLTNKQP
jgi:predicted nucleotidyltransferase component of viral defense system